MIQEDPSGESWEARRSPEYKIAIRDHATGILLASGICPSIIYDRIEAGKYHWSDLKKICLGGNAFAVPRLSSEVEGPVVPPSASAPEFDPEDPDPDCFDEFEEGEIEY